MIDAILTNTMLPQMSVALLERQMTGEQVGRIRVGVGADGFTYDFEVKAKNKKTSDQPKSKPAPSKKQPTGHAEAKTVPAEWGPSRRQVGEKPQHRHRDWAGARGRLERLHHELEIL